MTAKRCPICTTGMLGFVAHPTIRDEGTIRVMATCTDCRYVFFHHFFFDEMLTEIYAMVNAEDDNQEQKKTPHLKLVKTPDTSPTPALPTID